MLLGKHVVLRAWKDADVPAMQALRNDVELQASLMTEARPNSAERTRQWLSERSGRDDLVFFVIADLEGDKPLGFVQAAEINRRNGTGVLGICILPSAQGQGFGLDVIGLLEKYLSGVLGLRKLLLYVLANNARAIRLYEKCGFKMVGTLSRHYKTIDGYADVVVMEHLLDHHSMTL